LSTNWGYACISHDPPLVSECWFNHGEEVLVDAFLRERAGQWPSDPSGGDVEWAEPMPVTLRSYATTSPIYWLREHPRCEVVLHNEDGETRLIGETVAGAVSPLGLAAGGA
jgi:hypothetical protein